METQPDDTQPDDTQPDDTREDDWVLIRPSFDREGIWCVTCTCGFERPEEEDYRAAYTSDRTSTFARCTVTTGSRAGSGRSLLTSKGPARTPPPPNPEPLPLEAGDCRAVTEDSQGTSRLPETPP